MLNETKRDLTFYARRLSQPYENYSIDELADAYCNAMDTGNETLKNIYISALVLRFWYQIPKLHYDLQTFKVDYEQCYDGILDAICQACSPDNRKWQSTSISAEQVINQIIGTRFKAAVIYEANLQKNAGKHLEVSLEAPVGTDDESKTFGDTIESEDYVDAGSNDDITMLVQNYLNNNKIIEAIIIDNIAFNDVQKHFKKVVKTVNTEGEAYKYTEHSSEFWPYKLVQIVSKLPSTYKSSFMQRYNVPEEKLTAVLNAIDKSTNQKLYKYLSKTLDDLRVSYAL